MGLRVKGQINVGASIVANVCMHFVLWPLYAPHLLLCPPSRDDAEVHLPHRNLSEFAVVLLCLIRSLFPAAVHDLARVRKTLPVCQQCCSEYFCELGQFLRIVSGKSEFFPGWSRWLENYPDDVEYLRNVCKVSRTSGKILDELKSVQISVFRLLKNPDNLR